MRRVFFLLVLCLVTTSSLAQERRPVTADDIWKFKRLSSLDLSPDGKQAALVVKKYDIESNKGNGDIYLLSVEDGTARQFTAGKTSESNPVWSPDGKRIAFTAKRNDDENTQLYVINVGGGEARVLTDMPMGVSNISWFPDGRRIAFVSSMLPEIGDNADSLRAEIERRKESKVKVNITENRLFRYWDHYLTEGYLQHIYAVNVRGGDVTDLTPDIKRYFSYSGSVDYDISPDGSELLVSALTDGEPYNDLFLDIYTFPADGRGTMINLTESNPADDFGARYSPDGKYILYGRMLDPRKNAERTKLMRRDRGTGEEIELCVGFDRSPSGWVVGDDGRTVFFSAANLGRKSVFSVPMSGGAVTELLFEGSSKSLHAAGDDIVFLRETLSAPTALYRMKANGREVRKLSSFNDELLGDIEMGRVENKWFRGADGDSVQMFVVYPPGFNSKKSWPLLVLVHGGPHGAFGDSFHPRWNAQVFASGGYVAVMPNFHGSVGFGEFFADRINGEHPRMPFIDVMAAADVMIREPYIDSTRMAAAGGSYGGYLSAWIGAHTNRFACLINHAGVYNLMAQFGSDITHGRDISYGGTPWKDRDNILKWSPSQYAANYKTPTLVMHGEKDYRVPYGQGLELYGMLKAKDVPARLVVYPGENHWIQSAQNSIHWYGEFHAWLNRWIGNGGR